MSNLNGRTNRHSECKPNTVTHATHAAHAAWNNSGFGPENQSYNDQSPTSRNISSIQPRLRRRNSMAHTLTTPVNPLGHPPGAPSATPALSTRYGPLSRAGHVSGSLGNRAAVQR